MKFVKQKEEAAELEVPENFDQLPWEFETTCDICGKTFITTKQRYKNNKHSCCSKECRNRLLEGEPNCKCAVCNKPLHRKPSIIKKTNNITCSHECFCKLKKITMAGENNHQYGLKGKLNSSFKNEIKITVYGYKSVLNLEHPFHDSSGRVFEHRLVAEKYLLDDMNSCVINGIRYLKKDYDVHHIDFNKLNNSPENLCVMRKGDHVAFHNSLHKIVRDVKGKIKSIEKSSDKMSEDEIHNYFYDYIKNNSIYYHIYNTERGDGGIGSTGRK